jgi:hypothetical protein
MEEIMKFKKRLFIVSGMFLLMSGLTFLSACSMFSSSGDSARIDSLETQVQANSAQITALQGQVQELQTKVNSQPVTTPPVSTTTTPPASTTSTNTGLAPGSVSYTNLTVTPQGVLIGQTVTISVTVKNSGSGQGSFKVVVSEKMVSPFIATTTTEYANTITLGPGETKTTTFTTTKDLQSVYTLTAGTQSAQYSVNTPTPTDTPAAE